MDMYMIIKTDKERYAELFVKWYEDAEVLHMVKKRVVKAISMMDIDNVNNGVADTPKQKLKWYENPEILQIFKKMFGPSLYEDVMPDPTSFLSRCPKGFETDLRLVQWGQDPDILDMVHKRMFEPPLNEDGKPEGITFSSYFPACYGTYLQEAWPMVKSALEECDISCRLNLAIRVLSDIQWDIIKIGLLGGGLRSKSGITRDQCAERVKLLTRPLNILGEMTACDVFFREDNIAVMGSPLVLKLIRRIVVDCMVHKVDPVSRVNRISKFINFQVRKNLEDLHL
ncbi:uncharacterized protein LOC110759611 isoform X2 [Prunus avium]|nr:uncharacterized protein LOC110759611 isoform X2 [Prunus avium]